MTEQNLTAAIALQKHIAEVFSTDAEIINNKEKFEELDQLNRDLLVTEANALQTVLGIISVRIGLNISKIQQERVKADSEKQTEEGTTNETATEEAPKSEESVS